MSRRLYLNMLGLLNVAATCLLACSGGPDLMLEPVVEVAPHLEPEGPALVDASASLSIEATANDRPAETAIRERSEVDAYVETAIAASAAVVTSVDGGEKDPLAPETIADLAMRASAASLSTAANVALIRGGNQGLGGVDVAAVWVPDQGGGVVFTLRF